VVREHVADAQVLDSCSRCSDDEVENVASCVGRFVDMLNAVERQQQLCQAYGMWIALLVNVDVEVTAHDDRTAVDSQQLEHRRQFIKERADSA